MKASTLQPALAGGASALAGFFGSVAVLLTGLGAAGASREQAASALLVLCVVQGGLSLLLSARLRLPLAFVWSTPGAALLVAARTSGASFRIAVAAFIVAGALVVVTGAVPALARLIERVPPALSGALLAGILLPFCLAPVKAVVSTPLTALPLVVVWLVLQRFAPRLAAPVALLLALAVTVLTGRGAAGFSLAVPALVTPNFEPVAVLALAVPLYLVTMAGQNLPGLALLRANGYPAPTRRVLVSAGVGTLIAAPFGGLSVNMAAITGAMVVGPDASPDRDRRWIAGATSGVVYLLLAVVAAWTAGLIGSDPPVLVLAAAGLAILGAFVGGLGTALEVPATRLPAAITFLVVASGITVGGIGSALWGLVAGGIAFLLLRPRPEVAPTTRSMPMQ